MLISKFDLERPIFDLEGENSKFRRMRSLRIDPKNISVRFYRSPIKTVGQVPKSTKKVPKMTSLSPAPVEPKIGQPRNIPKIVTLSKIHLAYPSDFMMIGHWEGGQKVVTDGRLRDFVKTGNTYKTY